MSRREIQQFIHHPGLFTFNDGKANQGMIIVRYNIPEGKIEYYFIPEENVIAYQSAKSHQDLHAHRVLGTQINVEDIRSAEILN
ncbi:MAG TPA: hypothetical protein PKJ62_05075 [Bacteroidia bacterium]|nr:hypothetical protein [Bacteroidia bacterium]HNS12573.1 hypothetical protein [Bacteroidia bacterium]